MDAAVDYVLLNELFRNADTFRYSTYMHKSVGEKLVLGPSGTSTTPSETDGDAEDNAHDPGGSTPASPWAERLYADPAFRRRMADALGELRSQGLRRHIMQTIDSGAGQLAGGLSSETSPAGPFGTDVAYPDDPRTGAPPANHARGGRLPEVVAQGSASGGSTQNVTTLRP